MAGRSVKKWHEGPIFEIVLVFFLATASITALTAPGWLYWMGWQLTEAH
jgi:hypothetical protein